MRLFIPALFALLSIANIAHAETDTTPVPLTVQGALVSIPNSTVTLELGSDISGTYATQTKDGTITIQMTSVTPQSGFIIRELSMTQFKVTFLPKGENKAVEISPSAINDHAYSYLPLTNATAGGIFTITLPDQPIFQKKKKAFLN